MDLQRFGPDRDHRSTGPRVPFSLPRFEAELRRALDTGDDRECGTPGSSPPDFTGSTSRALKSLLLSSILSKYNPGTGDATRRAVALERFWEAEERCFWTNLKFCQSDTIIEEVHPGLPLARQAIFHLLGPEVPLGELSRGFGFGPGASTRVPRLRGDAVYKYSTEVEVTPNALALGQAAILAHPIWKQMFTLGEDGFPTIKTVWGNKVTTVEKNYKTDRTIAIEPDMNMYVQKGLGALLRRRLKKVGVDLDDQTLNQVAAAENANATIDFSMASDMVSQGIVKYLLPPNWCDMIASMRSEICFLEDGTLHRYSKVSSMGNGFTFELESLIFWALAVAVVPKELHHRIRVYGDDVIVPQEFAPAYLELAAAAGFQPNADKSFWEGPYRESCGKHFFEGRDVTPFFIKKPIKRLTDLFLLHNQLYRWRSRVDALLTSDEYMKVGKLLEFLRGLAPAKWRKPKLPDGYGDDAFIGSFAACNPSVSSDGWETFSVRVFAVRPPTVKVEYDKDKFRINKSVPHIIEVPDGGSLVKADRILRSHPWILPRVYAVELTVEPTQRGKGRVAHLSIPWWAWG